MKVRKIIFLISVFAGLLLTSCSLGQTNADREENQVENNDDSIQMIDIVGTFSTEDVFGNVYTQDVFAENDLTLVNAFCTWCSPCVREIPDLEKLRQEYVNKDVKFGVVGVVLDAKTRSGVDEDAVEKAKILYERSEVNFPFLIPDSENMNHRLEGIQNIPESFFVDKDGNIVSNSYVGANTLEVWREVVEQEFAKQQGESNE